MSTPILVTRIFVPPQLPKAIHRQRLLARLDEGLHRKLTLVSAPAGFGKTTLVSEWAAGLNRPPAWLSLDGTDNDVTRVLEYLIAALRMVEPTIGEGMAGLFERPQPPPPDAILTTLVNELSGLDETVILVLDDYHLVDSPAVDEAIAFLLDHQPSQLHLVITTREDPRLPLSRLRARGQMTELRTSDLRFTPGETVIFLRDVMGIEVSDADVAALETRTEGWIAGLQLAALSMQWREDLPGFIDAFAGDHRYIVDYLLDEVLARQPEHIRSFLLQTSILERFDSKLCDAVTGRDDSRALLDALERSNLFVVALDERRQWYRYHHLFADALRAHAMAQDPGDVALRHRAASAWHEEHGFLPNAVQHAIAAEDFVHAAAMIEMMALGMLGTRRQETLYGWLQAIPDELVRRMPVVSAYYGFASFSHAGLEAAEGRFQDAERWLGPDTDHPPGDMIIVNEAAYISLPGTIAVGRAYRAGALGDVDGIVRYAREARDITPATDPLWSGAASSVLGIGYWTRGDLEPAYRSFDEGKSRLEQAGYMQFQIVSVHVLADIRLGQGRLRDAERIYDQTLRLATEQGDATWGTVDVHVGLGELRLEQNDLTGALHHLQRAREPGEHAGLPDTRHRWYVAMAGVRAAEEKLDEAIVLLDEAERLRIPGADLDARPIAAWKTRIHVTQGRLDAAMEWARERELSIDDPLTYPRVFEHTTLARILLARYRRDGNDTAIRQSITLLDRLVTAAEEREWTGSLIEILVLQALAGEARGNIPGALIALERALSLAGPEGYVRVFVGEGNAMARLLAEAATQGISPTYTNCLLAAFGAQAPVPARTDASFHPFVEPLSDREMEVLRLIADGLSNQEIADRLFLALSTVKGHNREIFGKLEVQRRTEAVARAREMGML